MSDPYWFLLFGGMLITMVLAGTLLARLLMSSAMIYLCLGYLLGPGGVGLIRPNPFEHAEVLELLAEIGLLISLFTVGLRMGVPMLDRRWILPLRLAFVSMALTVGLIAVVGVWGLGMSIGEAVLLGGILAPTDPVLASGVQTQRGPEPDHLRFGLSGEGGLNDGTAFPFVLLGLGLLGHHELGAGAWRWAVIDLVWGTAGGLLIGALLGACIGRLVVYLRTRHGLAVGLDEFLSLGLVALAYGVAQVCLASGFLAVFAAGLALQRVEEIPERGSASLGSPEDAEGHSDKVLATHSHHASATMTRAVHAFNAQLEKLAELALVLMVGAMLPYTAPLSLQWWFIPLLFAVLRPFAVIVGTAGGAYRRRQRALISWLGIRGIGSIFYLLFAIRQGISAALTQQLVTLTLVAVAASILVHGASVKPLMRR